MKETPGSRAKEYRRRMGSILHVRTRFHGGWYAGAVLVTWVIVTQLPEDNLLWQRIIFGLAGALLFFILENLRQVLINLVTALIGVPVRNVSLFVFGGVSRVPRSSTRPVLELVIAVTGLLLNVGIAAFFQWLAMRESVFGNLTVAVIIQWLAFFWYMLAIFHLLPGLPLETGRILLVILWKTMGNYIRAVRITAWTGVAFGVFCIIGGVTLVVFRNEIVNGLLLAVFGWILQSAARQVYRRAVLLDALQDSSARDMMTREYFTVPPQISLEQLVNEYALITGHDYFAVAENHRLLGVVTVSDVRRVRRTEWHSRQVGDIMRPAERVKTIQADQTAAAAIEQMDQFHIDEIPVVSEDGLLGIVMRDRLTSLAGIRAGLRI